MTSDRATSPPFEFFTGAQHFNIEHQYISVNSPSSPTQDINEIHRLLSPVPGASHTRNTKKSPPDSTCLPGTRTQVLSRVSNWVKSDVCEPSPNLEGDEHGWRDDYGYYHLSPPTNKHVVWLCGPVGCGKSAIAQIVAEHAEEAGVLAASFFFFRGMGDRSKISRLSDTLACQMAEAIPSTAAFIKGALGKVFALQGASVETQFDRLIYDPIRAASKVGAKGPFLILLDGLDECEDRDEVEAFIDHMLGVFDRNPNLPLRFFVSSRIEEHIREHIETSQVHVLNLRDHHSDLDISTLVNHTFKVAASRNRVIRSYGSWPSEEETKALIRHAQGSFIFTRTLLNFILGTDAKRDGARTPMERFKLALDMDPGLDDLYDDILRQSQDIPHFHAVILTISRLQEPLSISGLSRLLDIPTFDIVNVLIPLQSVVHVPGDDESRVTLFHTSLRDFIRDETRSHPIFPTLVRLEHQELLAHRCLLLRFGVSEGSNESTFPYAMHYWISHWLEAYSHVGDVAHCIDILIGAGVGERSLVPLRLTSVLYDALDWSIASPSGKRPDPDSEHLWLSSLLGPSHSRAAMTFSRNVIYSMRYSLNEQPDPSALKCLIMHKMRSIASCREQSSILDEFIDGCIMPTLLRVIDAELDNMEARPDLLAFLQSSYLPEQITLPAGSHFLQDPYFKEMGENGEKLRTVAERIDGVWPEILSPAITLNPNVPNYSTFYKENGLTVLDLLNIHLELFRLSTSTEWNGGAKHMIVHAYDGMLICITIRPPAPTTTSKLKGGVTCLNLYTNDIFERFSEHCDFLGQFNLH